MTIEFMIVSANRQLTKHINPCLVYWSLGIFLMNCELCGSNIRGEVQAVNIDGGMFRVCNNCSKLGTAARVAKPPVNRPVRSSSSFSGGFSTPARNFSKPRTSTPPPSASGPFYQDEEMMLR